VNLFSIELSHSARKGLKKLSKKDKELVFVVLETLKSNPTPPRSVKLQGRDGYRIRVGDLRVIYTFERGTLIVLVLDIGHRREIYR
jgi:mRNA interferase RelE/StbE